MRAQDGEAGRGSGTLERRDWLRLVAGSVAAVVRWETTARSEQGPGGGGQNGSGDEEAELKKVHDQLLQAKIGPLSTVRSAHYQAIGDAAEPFMRLVLDDCEQLVVDYLKHFRARGFQVHPPDRRLTIILFWDNRSFGKFFHFPTQVKAEPGFPITTGLYNRATNLLYVFDWRNVPMAHRSSHLNMENLAHEGIHQLTCNTGLLNRSGDVPRCIVEGLGTYGESRKVNGPTELGRLNFRRLEELAKIQRRISWIPLRELIADDALLRAGNAARILLGYAQSWLLVYYLMKEPGEVPKFRAYLKAIEPRTRPDHRVEDAQAHLGDLDRLDRELRRYAIRLQMSL